MMMMMMIEGGCTGVFELPDDYFENRGKGTDLT